jgi:TRAP transporter TAXI family solute receptor
MKGKRFFISPLLIVCLAFLLSIVACASTAPSVTTTPSVPTKYEPPITKVTLITTSSGTVPHSMSVAWSTLLTKYPAGVQMSIEPTLGAPQALNAFLEGQGNAVFNSCNISRSEFPKYFAGKMLAEAPLLLMASAQTAVHIMTRADTDINTVADFRGKKILSKVPASPANDLIRIKILAAYGMTENDIVVLTGTNGAHLAQQLREGVGDAAISTLAVGDPAIVELCTVKDIRFISLPQDKMGFAEDLWMASGVILAGTYRGQDKQVLALRAPVSFTVRNNMDEKVAYTLVKTVYDNWNEYIGMVPQAKEFAMEQNYIAAFLPFHPGAVKYFKEKGMWTKEMEEKQQKLMVKVIPSPAPSTATK